MPLFAAHAALAQSAERLTRNEKVVGSIPTGGSTSPSPYDRVMLDAIGQVLPLAVVVTLSPAPVIAVVVVLLGADARRRGAIFLGGRVVGVALVVGVVTLFAETLAYLGLPALLSALLRLLLGLLLLVVGVRKLAGRSAAEPTPPAWMAALEGMSAARTFGLALVLSIANPKELAMGAATGLVIGSLIAEPARALLVGGVYTLIAVLGVALPVVAAVVLGERAQPMLADIRAWLDRNSAVLMAIVLIVFGAMLLGSALSSLATLR